MKKHIFFSAAMLALLAACSSEEMPQQTEVPPVKDSEVQIRLSSGVNPTRASLESDQNGLFNAQNLGIFCLAKGNLGVNPTELPIDWTAGQDDTSDDNLTSAWSVRMDNVRSEARINADQTATDILWNDGVTRFYPLGNWHSYRFYGYAPYQADITATSTQRAVDIPINGTQDIIWGRSYNADTDAYSAKYFRKAGKQQEKAALPFQHKLMRITFTYEAGPDYEGSTSTDAAKQVGIKSISINKVPSVAHLVIADRNDADNEGVVSYDWNNNLANFYMLDANDQPLSEEYWVDDPNPTTQPLGIPIGQGILLPVPVTTDYKYTVSVQFKDRNGRAIGMAEHPIELRAGAAFEAGHSYNVKLTVNGPKVIELTATLQGWINDDTVIGGITY